MQKNILENLSTRRLIAPVLDKTRAILIRRIPLTETSLIVHWCSDTFGLLKTVAKGARRPKSPFAGKLDLFFDCELEFVRARRGDLHTLKELAILDPRLDLRTSYLRTQAASYFGQLLECVVEHESPVPELTDLLRRALDYLNQQEPTHKAIVHFEKQLALHLGVLDSDDRNRIAGLSPIDRIADLGARIPSLRAELIERLKP